MFAGLRPKKENETLFWIEERLTLITKGISKPIGFHRLWLLEFQAYKPQLAALSNFRMHRFAMHSNQKTLVANFHLQQAIDNQ